MMRKQHDIRIDRTKLHPWLDYKLQRLLAECAKKGIYLIITEGFRTKEYQDKLYAKGRTAHGNIVTNAKGSTYSSQHMWGIAFDIAINDPKDIYNASMIVKVSRIAKSKKVGLSWGGDWTSIIDYPHFYLGKWGSTTTKLKQLYSTPDRFKKTWRKITTKEGGLKVYKHSTKLGGIIKEIPSGTKVKVMFEKSWYAKILLQDGRVGYVSKKYLS